MPRSSVEPDWLNDLADYVNAAVDKETPFITDANDPLVDPGPSLTAYGYAVMAFTAVMVGLSIILTQHGNKDGTSVATSARVKSRY